MALKPRVPPSERVSASLLKELADSAVRLNFGSDEFAKAIGPIDVALKKLNLGISAWFEYRGSATDSDGDFAYSHIGYAKVNGKWGLALSRCAGNIHDDPDDHNEEFWLFNDAPRSMRLEALDYIPDLLETLLREANNLAESLQKKAEQARALADTISTLTATAEVRR